MVDVYRHLANRIRTPDALDLAHDLTNWHDAMVRHVRVVGGQDAADGACGGADDDCPHTEAPDLWTRAQQVFGESAETLTFLRTTARMALDDSTA